VELKIFYRQPEAQVTENIGRVKGFGVLLAANTNGINIQTRRS